MPPSYHAGGRVTNGASASGALPEEQHDGEAVELVVGRLRHDLVQHLDVGVRLEPARDRLAELLALLRLGRGEDLHPGEMHRDLLSTRPRRPSTRSTKWESCRGVKGCQTSGRALPLDPAPW